MVSGRKTELLQNTRFGRWVVVSKSHDPAKPRHILVECTCSLRTRKLVSRYDLIAGKSTSCGCFRGELLAESNSKSKAKHGLRSSPLYTVWQNMLRRCQNVHDVAYHNYGGRGITVCDRWKEVANFVADMESTYFVGATIERKDTNAGYGPDNCIWIAAKMQSTNTRRSVRFSVGGQEKSLAELSEEYNIKMSTLRSRIYCLGMSAEDAVKFGKMSEVYREKACRTDGHKLYNEGK